MERGRRKPSDPRKNAAARAHQGPSSLPATGVEADDGDNAAYRYRHVAGLSERKDLR